MELFEGVRAAGTYRELILRDYKQLLRMRSLLARGRATIKSEHHPVIARLFGAVFLPFLDPPPVPSRRQQMLQEQQQRRQVRPTANGTPDP